MLRKTGLLIIHFWVGIGFGQNFLNGDFEINTAVVDQINLGSAVFDGFMSDCYSIGTTPNLDIITSATWGPPQNGNWFISLTGGGTDLVAMEMSNQFTAGTTYTFSFYDRSDVGFVSNPIEIGLSTNNTSFGTLIYTAPAAATNTVWTQRTVTFVAPNNGQFLVIRQQGMLQNWVHIDNFAMESCNFTVDLGNDTTLCDGDSIVLDVTQPNATYLWSDNSTSATNTISQTGTYWVEVTVDTCVASDTIDIAVVAVPNVNFSHTGNCLNEQINFVSNVTIDSGSINVLSWDFDDGTFGSTPVIDHSYNNTGTYDVSLTAVSDLGCSNSFNTSININAVPVSNFTGLDTCENSIFSFINNSTIPQGNIASYNWDFGDNTVSSLTSPGHSYQNSGAYTVELIVVSDSGCTDTSTMVINSHPFPLANFSTNTACFLANFNDLSSTSAGNITSYEWDFGDNNTSQVNSPTHTYQANGNYSVNLEVVNNFGCSHDTTFTVNISSNFSADFTADLLSICSGECVQFSNNSVAQPGQSTFLWEFEDGQISTEENPLVCFSTDEITNDYLDVTFTVQTANGCIDSITYTDMIEVIPMPSPLFSYAPDSIPLSNPFVSFVNESTSSSHFSWNFGDGSSSDVANPDHLYPEIANDYSVALTAYDLSKTCSQTYRTTIRVVDEIVFYVPNAFTPGSDNPNFIFKPIVRSGIDPYEYHLAIYNRWGEVLFESFDYNEGWDGTYLNDVVVPNGIYMWKIDFKETMSDKHHREIGHVMVLR